MSQFEDVREQWDPRIKLVEWSFYQLEFKNLTIIDYAKAFSKANGGLSPRMIAENLEDYWSREVRHYCRGEDEERQRYLLRQVCCFQMTIVYNTMY